MNKYDKVLTAIKDMKKDVKVSDLTDKLGMTDHELRCFLSYLKRNGKVENIGRGLYRVKDSKGNTAFVFELLFGLEIETEYNMDLLGSIDTSAYHTNRGCKKFGKQWFAERDGSLRTRGFVHGGTAEFISVPLKKSDVQSALKAFQKKTWTLAKKKCKLSEAFNFNDSTGAHVHMSLLVHDGKETTMSVKGSTVKLDGTNKDVKFVPFEFMHDFGRVFRRRVKKEMPSFYPVLKERYYRPYAKKAQGRSAYLSRYNEFNYTTSYGTIEYRSPSLYGIKTWEDFFLFYKVLTDTMQDCFLKELGKETPFVEKKDLVFETDEDNEDKSIKMNIEKGASDYDADFDDVIVLHPVNSRRD